MLVSMTGFAAVRESASDAEGWGVAVEVRSINHRHLKLSLRVSDGYASLEPQIESIVRETVVRGAVSMSVRIASSRAAVTKHLNTPLLESLFMELVDFKSRLGLLEPTTLESLFVFPELLTSAAAENQMGGDQVADDAEQVGPVVDCVVREAVRQMHQMRLVEGEAMAASLRDELNKLEAWREAVAAVAPRVPAMYRQRLTERLAALMPNESSTESMPWPEVAREVAIFADKCDVTEEIVRLQSHLAQFTAMLNERESVGRKLDFLLQEMFRETNTLGSKANDLTVTRHVVEMKNSLEKMREIVQNVE